MGVCLPVSSAVLLVLLSFMIPGSARAAPGIEVFNEMFPANSLDTSTWTVTSGSPLVDASAELPPSAPYALHLRGPGATITSRSIDLSRYSSGAIVVSWEAGGMFDPPELSDTVTFTGNLTSGIRPLGVLAGNGTATHAFQELTFPLPTDAFHAAFSLAIQNVGNANGNDHWFLDNIRVVAEPVGDLISWIPLGFGALGGTVTIFAVYAMRYRTIIEEIFLINRAGVLIRHATRRLRPDFDHDVMGGMLTAVQAFVQDSFRAKGELNEITYGRMRILIEGGEHLLLAAVLSRGFPGLIRRRMRNALDAIETEYANVLVGWDGDVHKFQDADSFLEELFVGAS